MKETKSKSTEVPQCACRQCQNEPASATAVLHTQMKLFASTLDEKQKRLFAGLEANRMGRGGQKAVGEILDLTSMTVRRGQRELEGAEVWGGVRRAGGGRKRVEEKTPGIRTQLERMLEDATAGDPITGVKWTRKSLRTLSQALPAEFSACPNTVRRLLQQERFSLRVNVKRLEGTPHEQRDDQFHYLATQKALFEKKGWPILSVDTKKKELIGLFRNPGRTWRQEPFPVNGHDFPTEALGKAIPYGIYDWMRNQGTVFVGTSADTAEFAGDSIAAWWQAEGPFYYPQAPSLLILCDSGGSNGYRLRLWKQGLQQKLADRWGLVVTVCHYPPGASKWNPIEHRMFNLISNNWAGQPLESYETVLNYIATTQSETGFRARAVLVEKTYETGIQVSDAEMKALLLTRHLTCPQWNYTIAPRS